MGVNTTSVYICSDGRCLRYIKEYEVGRGATPDRVAALLTSSAPIDSGRVSVILLLLHLIGRSFYYQEQLKLAAVIFKVKLCLTKNTDIPSHLLFIRSLNLSLNKKLALFYISEGLSDLSSVV